LDFLSFVYFIQNKERHHKVFVIVDFVLKFSLR